jgi:transposase-like protein
MDLLKNCNFDEMVQKRKEYHKKYYEEHKEKMKQQIRESYRERMPMKMIEKARAGYQRIPYRALKRYGLKIYGKGIIM